MQRTAIFGAGTYRIHLAASGAPMLDVSIRFADQAVKTFVAYREKYTFGASAMELGCGNIYDARNVLIGRISYNGRIWNAEGSPVE